MTPIILHSDHLILMDQNNTVISDGAVLVGTDGHIQAVGEAQVVIDAHPGLEVKRLEKRLVMPGLVSTHMHSSLLCRTISDQPQINSSNRLVTRRKVFTPHRIVELRHFGLEYREGGDKYRHGGV